MSTDRIEKQIELKAPVARVWKALTDYREFGEWFRFSFDRPFEEGKAAPGQVMHKGYEHMKVNIVVQKITPQTLFSYTWTPYPADAAVDYSGETPTLVEFTLKPIADGTLLTVVESGFDKLPAGRRDEAFRMNDRGWAGQMKAIEAYVAR